MDNGIYKVGDLVKNKGIWGNVLFVLESFHGNWYNREALVRFHKKEYNPANLCNFSIDEMELISFDKRPFKKLNNKILATLIKKGNIDAKREFIIRFKK